MELGRLWGQALSLNLGHLVMPTFDTATLSLNLGHLVVPTFDTATLSLNLGHLVVPTLDTASLSLNLGHLYCNQGYRYSNPNMFQLQKSKN